MINGPFFNGLQDEGLTKFSLLWHNVTSMRRLMKIKFTTKTIYKINVITIDDKINY